uniref:8 kDa Amblyomma family member n=1 Tax=Rhipicephalus appendiculatus TaxID=34631 RepID=A0A131Z3T9_RHIAP
MSMSVRVSLAFTFATISLLLIFVSVIVATSTDPFFTMSTCSGDCQTNSSEHNQGCPDQCQCKELLEENAGNHKGECVNLPPRHLNHSAQPH